MTKSLKEVIHYINQVESFGLHGVHFDESEWNKESIEHAQYIIELRDHDRPILLQGLIEKEKKEKKVRNDLMLQLKNIK